MERLLKNGFINGKKNSFVLTLSGWLIKKRSTEAIDLFNWLYYLIFSCFIYIAMTT